MGSKTGEGSLGGVAAAGYGRREAFGRGVACMVGGTALLTANDAVVKWVTADLPVGQIMFVRGALLLSVLTALLWARGRLAVIVTRDPRGQLLRGLAVLVSAVLFINALRLLPLADAVAIGFASPLFTTILAAWLLHEQVGWRRWGAVLAGFLGVLLVAQPSQAGLGWAALLPLAAALAAAFRDILTRHLSTTEHSLGVLFYTTAIVGAGGLLSLPLGWRALEPGSLGLLAASACLMGGAHFLQIEAFRYAEAAAITPYRYVALLWAVLLGFLVWGSLPSLLGWAGGALIIASGLYIWHRERRRRLVDAPAPPFGQA